MLEHYLALGSTEIANSARLAAYVDSVGSPLDSYGGCGCETLTAELVGDDAYTTPEEDIAPWYDPAVPESADFTGLMVLSVDGLDDNPLKRTPTAAVVGGAALGPARTQPLTITVTGVLLGVSCCGVEYGLRWLSQALAGETGAGCGGDCLTLFNCCPTGDQAAGGPEEFAAQHRRTLRRVALTSGPIPTARSGTGCTGSGGCSHGADMLTVEFVLTAGTPWLWTDPMPVLEVPVPTDDGSECITWCIHDAPVDPVPPTCLELTDGPCPSGAVTIPFTDGSECEVTWPDRETATGPCAAACRFAPCTDVSSGCTDPGCRTPAPPVPPPPSTCFCHAVAVNSALYEVDLTHLPLWFGAAPVIEVSAGGQELRRVTITLFKRGPDQDGLSCEEVAEDLRCAPHSVFEVAYVPAGGVLTLDGQIGRAVVDCDGECATSSDAYGRDGGPLAFPLLDAAQYCVLVEADALVSAADDATITVSVSGRQY